MARHPESDPGGKLIASLETDVSQDMHDDFVALARLRRKTKGEYLREVVARHVYGELEHVQRLAHGRSNDERGNVG